MDSNSKSTKDSAAAAAAAAAAAGGEGAHTTANGGRGTRFAFSFRCLATIYLSISRSTFLSGVLHSEGGRGI